jgi:hypothetical protein
MRRKLLSTVLAVLTLLSLIAAIPAFAQSPSTDTGRLRTVLGTLLGEHVALTTAATGAALAGRTDEFKAAAATLDGNTIDLGAAVGSLYGPDAQKAFLALWRNHIGFFVDYTTGLGANDKAKQDKAQADLQQYTVDFGTLIHSVAPSLPADAVAASTRDHVKTLTAVINDQAAKDTAKEFSDFRTAYAHMDTVAKTLAGGFAQSKSGQFTGTADSPEANLRAGLTRLLTEHVAITSYATGAALGGRNDEFKNAAAALDTNTVDLGSAIGSVYGADAQKAFLALWRNHIGFFVDYTTGLAANDKAKQDKGQADLQQYTMDFGTLIHSVAPSLPADAVAASTREHVATLTAVINAQAAKDPTATYTTFRKAFAHMPLIANTLTDAIAKQMPAKFGAGTKATNQGAAQAGSGKAVPAPSTMPVTGSNPSTPILPLAVGLGLLLIGGGWVARRSSQARNS